MKHLVIGISQYNNINKLAKSTTFYVVNKKNKQKPGKRQVFVVN